MFNHREWVPKWVGQSTGRAGGLGLSILTPEQLEPNDGGEMVMGLAKVGQHAKGKRHRMLQSGKKHHLLITSGLVFLFVCRKGEGHKEDEEGEGRRRVERDGFNVAITVVRWQLGCDSAIVQSCLYKVGQKHMTCTSDSQRTP